MKNLNRLVAILSAAGMMLFVAPHAARSQNIQGFAANWLYFGGAEASSHATPGAHATGGNPIYSNQVTVPASINVLYVGFDATADLNGNSNSMFVGCLVDGTPCNDNPAPRNDARSGWVMVQKLSQTAVPDNISDQAIHYTWCTPVKKLRGPKGIVHSIQLRLASGDGDFSVSLEQMHVFVNGVKIGGRNAANACTNAGTP